MKKRLFLFFEVIALMVLVATASASDRSFGRRWIWGVTLGGGLVYWPLTEVYSGYPFTELETGLVWMGGLTGGSTEGVFAEVSWSRHSMDVVEHGGGTEFSESGQSGSEVIDFGTLTSNSLGMLVGFQVLPFLEESPATGVGFRFGLGPSWSFNRFSKGEFISLLEEMAGISLKPVTDNTVAIQLRGSLDIGVHRNLSVSLGTHAVLGNTITRWEQPETGIVMPEKARTSVIQFLFLINYWPARD